MARDPVSRLQNDFVYEPRAAIVTDHQTLLAVTTRLQPVGRSLESIAWHDCMSGPDQLGGLGAGRDTGHI
jgi:hypothetical protein